MAVELLGPGDVSTLLPEERACCTGFAAKRTAEFAAGRACARAALRALGYADVPLLPKPDRSPRWPPGSVGSITHTGDFCAAVVAESARFAGIGLDAEIAGRVTADLWPRLFTDADTAQLAAAPEGLRAIAATIMFSAKEAFYKCQFTLTGGWVGFRDVSIAIDPPAAPDGTFVVAAAPEQPSHAPFVPLIGRFVVDGDLVLTGIAIASDSARAQATVPNLR